MTHQELRAPMACTVVDLQVAPGSSVNAGQLLIVLEAMKMEHELRANADAVVLDVAAQPGETMAQGDLLLRLGPPRASTSRPLDVALGATSGVTSSATAFVAESPSAGAPQLDLQTNLRADLRADLREVLARHAFTLDAQRAEAMAKRHARGQRSARENIADLCDAGSFVEYGALALAAQSQRRSQDDLLRNTPADGMVCGIGSVNAARFGATASRCVVIAYDATVLAGTQGCASTTCAASCSSSPTAIRCSSCAPVSARASSPRWRESRAERSGCWRATRCIWVVRSTPTPPTRQHASCSCATPMAWRSSALSIRPASWSAPTSKPAPRCAMSAACSSPARH